MTVEKDRKKIYIGPCLMLICAGCVCASQFIWKYFDGLLPLIIGFGIYGIGALSMLCAYHFGSLSALQPINSISYVFSAIIGYIFFNEVVTTGKIAGIMLIMAGVVLLAKDEVTE